MKKFIVAAVLFSTVISFAAGREYKDIINKTPLGKPMINGWRMNSNRKDPGNTKIIQGSKADEKALYLASVKDAVSYYSMIAYNVKPGEKFEMSCDVKGKGFLTIGYYNYTAKNGYFPAVQALKTFQLTDTVTEIKFETVIKPGAKGEIPGKIRPFFMISKGGEVTIEDFEFEIEDADKD